MTKKVELVIRYYAKLDIIDIYDWYEEQREGLGNIFLSDLISCLNSISENPKAFPIVFKK